MEASRPGEEPRQRQNDIIREAFAVEVDPIDVALLAVEGDQTIIVTNAVGVPRVVTFIAPRFPPTYEG